MQQYPLKRRATATSAPTRYANPLDVADQLDYPGEPARMPSSAVRFVDRQGNTVIQRGNQRFIIHDEPPPRQRRRRPHWLAIFGVGMVAMLLLWAAGNWLGNKWQETQNDWTYTSSFRTFNIDYAVGHGGDSVDHPSHFIVQNDHTKIVIIEFPKDDPSKLIVYYGPALLGDGQDRVPLTISFQVNSQTGRVDMVLHVEGQSYIFTNNGTKFVQPQ